MTGAVDLHHLPQWLCRRFQARDGAEWRTRFNWGAPFLDHWGSLKAPTVPKGDRLFVAEPYDVCVDQLAEFCRRYGLWVTVSPHSEWFPGQTLRITFRPTETTLGALRGMRRKELQSPPLPDGWLDVDDGIEWRFGSQTSLSVRRVEVSE